LSFNLIIGQNTRVECKLFIENKISVQCKFEKIVKVLKNLVIVSKQQNFKKNTHNNNNTKRKHRKSIPLRKATKK
jgi:hypothetical protein